jgi:hypothetical protein
MLDWIFPNQTTHIIVAGIGSFFLICGPSADAQEVGPITVEPCYVCTTNQCRTTISPDLERSVRFRKLVSQWLSERGATSSIEEMCTHPAYLSIMAMGPDALPLLLGQLRSEGDNPDHWFVALHYITGQLDPVPAEDKGNMAKMARAWLEWAARENDAW